MSVEGDYSIHHSETSTRKLVYVEEFKRIIKENPGVISAFKEIERQLGEQINRKPDGMDHGSSLKVGDVFEKDNVKVTIISPSHSYLIKRKPPGVYLKVEVGEESFFVKRIGGYFNEDKGLGANELISIKFAKELLEYIEWVDVVDFQLGYQETLSPSPTYFVSKWIEGIPMQEYISNFVKFEKADKNNSEIRAKSEEELAKLFKKIEIIEDRLKPVFLDVGTSNMLYDPKSKKIIIYDIHLRKTPEHVETTK